MYYRFDGVTYRKVSEPQNGDYEVVMVDGLPTVKKVVVSLSDSGINVPQSIVKAVLRCYYDDTEVNHYDSSNYL